MIDYLADAVYLPDQRQVAIDLSTAVSEAAQHNRVLSRLDSYIKIIHVATRRQSGFNFGCER